MKKLFVLGLLVCASMSIYSMDEVAQVEQKVEEYLKSYYYSQEKLLEAARDLTFNGLADKKSRHGDAMHLEAVVKIVPSLFSDENWNFAYIRMLMKSKHSAFDILRAVFNYNPTLSSKNWDALACLYPESEGNKKAALLATHIQYVKDNPSMNLGSNALKIFGGVGIGMLISVLYSYLQSGEKQAD